MSIPTKITAETRDVAHDVHSRPALRELSSSPVSPHVNVVTRLAGALAEISELARQLMEGPADATPARVDLLRLGAVAADAADCARELGLAVHRDTGPPEDFGVVVRSLLPELLETYGDVLEGPVLLPSQPCVVGLDRRQIEVLLRALARVARDPERCWGGRLGLSMVHLPQAGDRVSAGESSALLISARYAPEIAEEPSAIDLEVPGIVARLVNAADGWVDVYPAPGGSVEFALCLPLLGEVVR